MENDTDREETVGELADNKLDENRDEQQAEEVSRRETLGIAGLVGLGAVGLGSQSAGAVEGHTLSQDLNCNGNDLDNVNFIKPHSPYISLLTNGEGNGNIQLFDAKAGMPFLRASETQSTSEPGPVMFNTGIRGMPDEATGADITPGPLRIIDDVDIDGNAIQDVGAVSGDVTGGQRLESLAGQNITIADGQLNASAGEVSDDLQNRLDDAVTQLEVIGGTANRWRVGPSGPGGKYDTPSSWGILIDTDRPVYLGECTIDANEAGQFTPALCKYEDASADPNTGDHLSEIVDSITIQASGGTQTIFLDFLIDEPGRYLLMRKLPTEEQETDAPVPADLWKPEDDPIQLRKQSQYTGYSSDSQNGVTFKGGYNPYAPRDGPEDTNSWYYYYFDLEISSAANA